MLALALVALSLTLVVDGAVVPSYTRAYVDGGRVFAPIDPFLTAVVDHIGYDRTAMIVTRGDRFAQIPLARPPSPGELRTTYVAVAPILRTLGETVHYDPVRRELDIETPERTVALPTPFNAAVPRAEPTAVFTPTPAVTPRPVFSGPPLPRRTPVPVCCGARTGSRSPRRLPQRAESR